MALYTFQDLTLEVRPEGQETGEELAQLLRDLSWVRTPALGRNPSLCLAVSRHDQGLRVPRVAREVFRADGICGLERGDDFYLTDGASLFHLQPGKGQGAAQLAPSFGDKPPLLQRNFWAFGLLKLLRPLGLYSLHAAGVVTRNGLGLLIVGGSGCGKSTLALGVIRQGWGYLSDDAVLLRLQAEGVEALAFRKDFSVDADATVEDADLPFGEEGPDTSGGRRRRVRIHEAFPGQYVPECLPQLLLFARLVPHMASAVRPLDRLRALRALLVHSGPQLFDRGTMAQHLEVLKRLVHQTATYELQAGLDLYRHPLTLVHLLAEVEGEDRWPGL